jgi:hypothetical protein
MDTFIERIYMESVGVCTGSVSHQCRKERPGPDALFAEMQETPRYAVLAPLMEGAGIGSEWMLCGKKDISLAVRMRVLWVSLVSLMQGAV